MPLAEACPASGAGAPSAGGLPVRSKRSAIRENPAVVEFELALQSVPESPRQKRVATGTSRPERPGTARAAAAARERLLPEAYRCTPGNLEIGEISGS